MIRIRDRAHMSIGREWSLSTRSAHVNDFLPNTWRACTPYNYGMWPPRYPVPAVVEAKSLTEEDYESIRSATISYGGY